jgi:hypothetical protein
VDVALPYDSNEVARKKRRLARCSSSNEADA